MYIKYLFVGVINTFFGYMVLVAFLLLGFHYVIAVLVATILGILFNYRTYGHFVFKNKQWSVHKFARFLGFYVVLYILNISIIAVMKFYGVNIYVSSFMAMILIAYLGFVFNRRYVYAEKN